MENDQVSLTEGTGKTITSKESSRRIIEQYKDPANSGNATRQSERDWGPTYPRI